MREIEAKRTPCSKTFDLGDGRHRLDVGQQPKHYEQDGRLLDIDLTPEFDAVRGCHALRNCPYALQVAHDAPAHVYNSRSGKRVSIELVTEARGALAEGGLFKWGEVGRDTDYIIQPLPGGCATLLVLNTPSAPREWSWRVQGDMDLIVPLVGQDSARRRLELIETRDPAACIIAVRWTGRTMVPRELRRQKQTVWTDDVTWPVVIDPTVNENIAANGDDVWSYWKNNGATFSSFNAYPRSYLYAGRANAARSYAGLRFQTIAIPAGSTVNSATLTIRVTGVTGSPNINIFGNAVDDAAAFTSPANRIKAMTKTSASVNKTSWTNGADNAITVTSIISELLGRAGWASNNDVALGFFNNSGASVNFVKFAALEHATLTEARLSIDYTAGGGGGGTVLDHYADKEFQSSRFVKPRFLIRQ
jgi:hypothetical protein